MHFSIIASWFFFKIQNILFSKYLNEFVQKENFKIYLNFFRQTEFETFFKNKTNEKLYVLLYLPNILKKIFVHTRLFFSPLVQKSEKNNHFLARRTSNIYVLLPLFIHPFDVCQCHTCGACARTLTNRLLLHPSWPMGDCPIGFISLIFTVAKSRFSKTEVLFPRQCWIGLLFE